jgi:hypothetical protein
MSAEGILQRKYADGWPAGRGDTFIGYNPCQLAVTRISG